MDDQEKIKNLEEALMNTDAQSYDVLREQMDGAETAIQVFRNDIKELNEHIEELNDRISRDREALHQQHYVIKTLLEYKENSKKQVETLEDTIGIQRDTIVEMNKSINLYMDEMDTMDKAVKKLLK